MEIDKIPRLIDEYIPAVDENNVLFNDSYDNTVTLTEIEKEENKIRLYTLYQRQYTQLTVKKPNGAIAGWSHKNKSHGIPINFTIELVPKDLYCVIVFIDVNYRGSIARASLLIDEDNEVSYISELCENTLQNPKNYTKFNIASNTIQDIVNTVIEDIRIRLKYILEDED